MGWLVQPAVWWSLVGLLALIFFAAGLGKAAAIAPSPQNFARWGLSPNVMRAVGAAEIAGAIGLLIPRLAPFAAIGLGLVMLGAIRTGVVFKEALHVLLPAILVALLALVVYARV
jgi:putative oxidoreductase